MTSEKTVKEALQRATEAITLRIKVRLNNLIVDRDRFCHRDKEALDPKDLEPLTNSLALEGLQVPIEVVRDAEDRFVVVKGHRRVSACRLLADRKAAGFAPDMELEALEVQDATDQDLLVRSLADNEVRRNLSRTGRIRAARKLSDAEVEEARAAAALGVSIKTYQRDLLIAQHDWMRPRRPNVWRRSGRTWARGSPPGGRRSRGRSVPARRTGPAACGRPRSRSSGT